MLDLAGIEGSWWLLRRPTWADEPAIAAHGRHSDPLWIGIGPSEAPERAQQVMKEILKGVSGAFGVVYFAVDKDSDSIIGMVGTQQRRPRTVEIVYGVAPDFRGRGLATEILASVTCAAREQDAARRYELVIDADNSASIRVAEKCDYELVGTRHSVVNGHAYEDQVYVPHWSQPDRTDGGALGIGRPNSIR